MPQRDRSAHYRATAGPRRPAASAPTGASSTDPDSLRIDSKLMGVLNDEPQPGLAVVQRFGVGRFGCQPVFDADADTAQLAAPLDEARVVHVAVADHHPAAVHPVQDGRLGGGFDGA